MLSKEFLSQLPIKNIKQATPVSGGLINFAYHLKTDLKDYFLLVQKNQKKSVYANEIESLKFFAKAHIPAPLVLSAGEIEENAYLLISYINSGSGKQSDVGKLLAKLHSFKSPNGKFGFKYPEMRNYNLHFDNSWTDSWIKLFVYRRLDVMKDSLLYLHLWKDEDKKLYLKIRPLIIGILNKHHSVPSLLHGDLWEANYMYLKDGTPAFIDPNSTFGDRELDFGLICMSNRLSSNPEFSKGFYTAYQNAYPLDKGFSKRIEFYILYFLMIHLQKFGSFKYFSAVNSQMHRILALDN